MPLLRMSPTPDGMCMATLFFWIAKGPLDLLLDLPTPRGLTAEYNFRNSPIILFPRWPPFLRPSISCLDLPNNVPSHVPQAHLFSSPFTVFCGYDFPRVRDRLSPPPSQTIQSHLIFCGTKGNFSTSRHGMRLYHLPPVICLSLGTFYILVTQPTFTPSFSRNTLSAASYHHDAFIRIFSVWIVFPIFWPWTREYSWAQSECRPSERPTLNLPIGNKGPILCSLSEA